MHVLNQCYCLHYCDIFPKYSVTCDITRLIREKCYPPNKDHESWLVDPLKFEVDLPAYGELVFVAVISEHSGLFVLHEVYQQQKRGLNTSFDIVQPGR